MIVLPFPGFIFWLTAVNTGTYTICETRIRLIRINSVDAICYKFGSEFFVIRRWNLVIGKTFFTKKHEYSCPLILAKKYWAKNLAEINLKKKNQKSSNVFIGHYKLMLWSSLAPEHKLKIFFLGFAYNFDMGTFRLVWVDGRKYWFCYRQLLKDGWKSCKMP